MGGLVLGVGAGPAGAFPTPTHGTAADPTVTGPILPSSGIEPFSLTFLSQFGYEQSEYFISGTATSYVPTDYASCGTPCIAGPSNGESSVRPYSTASYTTRVVVYRPIDPRKFNGTVMVEWLNVSLGLDIPAVWGDSDNELIREGVAWVGVSAQAVGVDWLVTNDPARYGSLSDPGDSYSYDIFSQAGQAVWDNSAQLLGGLTPRHLIATGESQSASYLSTYVDAVAPLANVYNGYLLDSRLVPAALSQSPQPAVTPGNGHGFQFRTDISTPVFEFETESDVFGLTLYDRQPNTNQFRLWEVAGTSHGDYYGVFVGPTVTGTEGAILNLAAMQNPPSTIPGFGTCPYPINTGGAHWILNAAVWWINQWVVNGQAPPIPPLLQTTTTPGVYPVFVTDANGNVLGGVRSPQVDAPIATLSGAVDSEFGTTCFAFGSTIPFSPSTLTTLYPTHAQFVSDWDRAVQKDVLGGYLLLTDALALDNSALLSDIGSVPGSPQPTTLRALATVSPWKALDGLIVFSGTLTATGQGIAGQMVTFSLNNVPVGGSCTATTDSFGVATCELVMKPLSVVLRIHSFTASYGGSIKYEPSSMTGTIHS